MYSPLHCKNDWYDIPTTDYFLKIENRYIRGEKCWTIIWHSQFSELFAFLISVFRRSDWKETSLSIWRKWTVLSSLQFIQPCIWTDSMVPENSMFCRRVQMHCQSKLHQIKLRNIITKTCSSFTPQSTSVSQLVSSSDSQTHWLSKINKIKWRKLLFGVAYSATNSLLYTHEFYWILLFIAQAMGFDWSFLLGTQRVFLPKM